uniref:Uncharacterized protein n=1 Tax=Brassica campestris TaxID=3711 RepID=M4EPU3_BRACM
MCFVRGREAEAIKRFRVSELYDAAGNSRIRSTVHRNPPNSSPPEVRIRRHLSSLCELSLSLSLSPNQIHSTSESAEFFSTGSRNPAPSLVVICNGKGYVAYRNFISRPRKWENLRTPSLLSSPGNSGRWLPSPAPLSHQFEAESFTSSRDLRSANQVSSRRLSFSSSFSDGDHSFRRGGGGFEHAYSFVGMHCIFDQCKSSVWPYEF